MKHLDCFVVGMGSLPDVCCSVLANHGFLVRGIHSPDGSLVETARRLQVEHVAPRKAFEARLLAEPYDYLFSLNNPWIIPGDVIAKSRIATVNYHDSPLPKYAGLHATSWALIHGETEHAVTFHEVTKEIDAGAILKQRQVEISRDDTAWTLNAKCFEAAVEAFRELSFEIAKGRLSRTPQPSTGGTYFGRRARPPRAGVLDLTRPAEELRNLVRALDFGRIDNPLGRAKLFVGGELVCVRHAEVTLGRVGAPGQVVEIGDGTLELSTGTTNLRFSEFSTLEGRELTVRELAARAGLARDRILPELPVEIATALARRAIDASVHESRMAQALAAASPSDCPLELGAVVEPRRASVLPHFGVALDAALDGERSRVALGSLFALLSRFTESGGVGIGLSIGVDASVALLFDGLVPLEVEVSTDDSFRSFTEKVERGRAQALARGSYSRDLFARFAKLAGKGRPHFGVAVAGGSPDDASLDPKAADVALRFPEQGVPELVHHGRLEGWQIDSLDGALAAIARVAIANPDTPLVDLPLLGRADLRRVLVEWNDTASALPARSVHDLVRDTVARTPDATAVRFAGRALTYRELDEQSSEVARRLRRAGVCRGDVVALGLPRSLELVVGLLGILKAGAAYLPVEPSYPVERAMTMVSDAQARFALTNDELASKYFTACATVLLPDASDALDTRAADATSPSEDPLTTPDDLVYVIYTSGSTGKPKGVEVRHSGLVNHSLAIAKNYGLGPGDRVLFSASIGFDVAAEQIYPALFTGAEVVVRPDDLFDSFARFDGFVRDEGISVMVLPTAFWHEWVRELDGKGARTPESLRALSVGTEKALGEHLTTWQRLSGGRVRFFQGYGPTEATVTCTMYEHVDSTFDERRPLPIGRPLPNTHVYLLDACGKPVPIGFSGELYVGGAGLARGYRNNPTLTRERFVTRAALGDERLYRTGDLARYLPDGQIVFRGRRDFQVKLRGFRVELGEIEQVLREHPSVSEAVVVLRSDYGTPELVAYVVPASAIRPGELHEAAQRRLPEYMVPRAIVELAAFPRTTNQKIDRASLPAPPRAERAGKAATPPHDPVERTLHDLWVELLPGPSFGIDEDFFALGGDSLLAVRMLSAVEGSLGRSIALSQFAPAPTIRRLARLVQGDATTASLVVHIQRGGSRPPLWVLHPVGGHVVYAQVLRRHMDPLQPIIGIQARGLDGRDTPLDTVEALADLYVGLIQREQPHGPYYLAGPSMGGLIAYEIAQRLTRAGETVALLALLDAWGPDYPRPTPAWVRVGDQLQTLLEQPGWRARAALLRDRLRSPRASTRSNGSRFVPPRYEALAGVQIPAEMREAIERVTRANEHANERYRPTPYPGRVLLFRAAETLRWSGMRFDDRYNGWRPLAGEGVERVTIACSHIELADNPPPEVGRELQRAIDRAQSGITTPLPPPSVRGPASVRLRALERISARL